jgi:hypothetical protein
MVKPVYLPDNLSKTQFLEKIRQIYKCASIKVQRKMALNSQNKDEITKIEKSLTSLGEVI